MNKLIFRRILVTYVLFGLLIVGCANQQPEPIPAPTETQTAIIPTNTAPPPDTATPTLPPPTPTEPTEVIEPEELDFSSIEGIKIYYSTNTGIEFVELTCGDENSSCSESAVQQLVDFSQMTSFTQIDSISLLPGEDEFIFSSGNYSHNGSDDLFSYDAATGLSARLTDTTDYNDTGWLSPDGQYLAVVADRNGGGHSYLHTIGRDGCCLKTIPHQLTYDQAPAWSPGGEQIAFFSEDKSGAKLFVYDLNTQEVRELMSGLSMKKSGAAIWSPDGLKLALATIFDQGADICVVDFSAGDSLCLAEDKHIERLPSWSADSSQLLYSAFDIESGSEDIYQVNADGTEKTQITFTASYQNPVWLNANFFICETQNQGEGQLILMSYDGTWIQPISSHLGGASLLKIVYP